MDQSDVGDGSSVAHLSYSRAHTHLRVCSGTFPALCHMLKSRWHERYAGRAQQPMAEDSPPIESSGSSMTGQPTTWLLLWAAAVAPLPIWSGRTVRCCMLLLRLCICMVDRGVKQCYRWLARLQIGTWCTLRGQQCRHSKI